MTDVQLTIGDLYEIVGLTREDAAQMTRNGVVCPTCNAEGRGHHKTYGLLDALAMAFAMKWGDMFDSVPLGTTAGQFVQNLGLDGVERNLRAGKTVLLLGSLAPKGVALVEEPVRIKSKNGDERSWPLPDLAETLAEVEAKIAEIRDQRVANRRGRTTGLTCNQSHAGMRRAKS